jgi:hypothetical protein
MRKIIISILVCVSFFFTQCGKKDIRIIDYRDKYVGVYNFTTSSNISWYYYYGAPPKRNDTIINYTGTVVKHEKDRLKIVFLPNATDPELLDEYVFPIQIKGRIYPVVNDTGRISYPEIRETYSTRYGFRGVFFNNDSLVINYGISLHYGAEHHTIHGKKIK